MYIHEIEIENFKSIKHIKISELGNLTIFYGENNVGKSNILHALHFYFDTMKRMSEYNFQTEGKIIPKEMIYKCDISKEVRIRAIFDVNTTELKEFYDRVSTQNLIKHELMKIPETAKVEITLSFSVKNESWGLMSQSHIDYFELHDIIFIKDKKFVIEQDKSSSPKDPIRDLGFSHFFKCVKQYFKIIPWFRFIQPEIRKNESNVDDIDNYEYTNALFFLMNGKSFQSKITFEMINKDFKELTKTGDISFVLDVEKETGQDAIVREKGTVEIYIKDHEIMIPLSSLGSSAQQILNVLIHYHVFSNSVIGFEEPEIHLSPKSQYEFFNYIYQFYDTSKTNRQMFITTHSPIFIKKGNILEVKYDDKIEATIINMKPTIENQKNHFLPFADSLYPPCFGKEYNEQSEKCKNCLFEVKPDCKSGTEEYRESFLK